MKVRIRVATVQLVAEEGENYLLVNGVRVPIDRDTGLRLWRRKRPGCQSRASRMKLSNSLKRYWAGRSRKEK